MSRDTDGDGVSDSAEVTEGTDPSNPADFRAWASRLINYQGRLMDSGDVAVGGTVDMTFAVFDGLTSATALWFESHQVGVKDGIYNLMLGGDTAIP
ncbi:MAG: thrombospondin type 3 repeat-containing protein, partial [Planctomycetota bacterium]